MTAKEDTKAATKQLTAVEKLVVIADAMFERATKLDNIKLDKDSVAAQQEIEETMGDAYLGTINLWKVIIIMLPTATIGQAKKTELEVDGQKVISRCYHRLGNLAKAREHIIKSIDLGYPDGFISLGAICLDLKDYDGAKTAFSSALAKEVQTMRAHAGLGELYFSLGTNALRDDPGHTEYFVKAEEEFLAAGRERFSESFERAMELFDRIGWRDKASQFAERTMQYYGQRRVTYGGGLRAMSERLRKLAGDDRHNQLVEKVGRRLGDIFAGGKQQRKP